MDRDKSVDGRVDIRLKKGKNQIEIDCMESPRSVWGSREQ